MSRKTIFIDESGDAGITSCTSSRFIIAAVVVMSDNDAELISKRICEFRKLNGLSEHYEIKFSKTRKDIIKDLLRFVSCCDFQVYGIVVDKMKSNYKANSRYSLYNSALVELLKTIPHTSVKIIIDGEAGKNHQKAMASYLRQQLIGKMQIDGLKYVNSRSMDELQLADVVAGSINRYYSNQKDAGEYVEILKSKIVEIMQK